MTLGRPGALLAGRYRLDRLLGGAGSAERWQAYDERLARSVTARLTPAAEQDAEGTVHEGAAQAAQAALAAMARLNHPGVAAVYDVGTVDELPGGAASYTISERTDGRTLEQIMVTGPQPWPRTADWGRQISGALAALHEVGLTHGALGPNSVAIHDDRQVKILDAGFGAARDEDEGGEGVGDGDEGEQQAQLPVGAADDVYALGALLWEATVGAAPEEREGERELDLQPLRQARVPSEMVELLVEMLDADPSQRPTAAAAEQRFVPLAATDRTTGTLPVTPAPPLVGTSTTAPSPAATAALAAAATAEQRRRRGLVTGLVLLLAALGAGLGLLVANLGSAHSANPDVGDTVVPSTSPGTVTLPSGSPSSSSSPSQARTSAGPATSVARSGSPSVSASASRPATTTASAGSSATVTPTDTGAPTSSTATPLAGNSGTPNGSGQTSAPAPRAHLGN